MDKPRALVIEDDEDTNELICSTLESAGYITISALDGDDGLKKAMEHLPDIIMLDVMMPKLDGIGVCRALKNIEATRSIPVIMVTARDGLSDKLLGYISGARRYLIKPFELDDLILEVETTLRQQKTTKTIDSKPDLREPEEY